MSKRSKWDEPAPDFLPMQQQQPPQQYGAQPPFDPNNMMPPANYNNMMGGMPPAMMGMAPQQQQQPQIFEREILINDAKNRYNLTKTVTLTEISNETSSSITVRGKFYKPGETPGSSDERPLYLHVTADTEDALERAVRKIEGMMNQFPMQNKQFIIEKVFVGLDAVEHGFNLPLAIIGPNGTFVKYIRQQCGNTKVQLKGRGFKDQETGQEINEPMHLQLTSGTRSNSDKAKIMAQQLIDKVRKNYATWLENRTKAREMYNAYVQYYNHYNQNAYYQAYAQQQQMAAVAAAAAAQDGSSTAVPATGAAIDPNAAAAAMQQPPMAQDPNAAAMDPNSYYAYYQYYGGYYPQQQDPNAAPQQGAYDEQGSRKREFEQQQPTPQDDSYGSAPDAKKQRTE